MPKGVKIYISPKRGKKIDAIFWWPYFYKYTKWEEKKNLNKFTVIQKKKTVESKQNLYYVKLTQKNLESKLYLCYDFSFKTFMQVDKSFHIQ